ncbi:hypothetical protein [Moraxella osloensis]|jgi:hypothetical protein|uniref:Uncharacterized protein n=1 Tax=Faucicola osloensis TaxID=34062 RepID=A0A2D2LX59_FAUOS|nr:hypothetical protein [Moraxella osloensis]ATR79615.1 hypothetical protein NP7_09605 [Moraxella osloensis]MDI4510295.1 hypothetical protein [Moraxella osloensis]
MKITDIKQSINDKVLAAFVLLPAIIATMPAEASTSLSDAYSADKSKAGSLTSSNGGNADAGLGIVYKLLSGVFILVGLWFIGTGFMKVRKASNSEGRESPTGGWVAVVIGGALATSSYILWTMSKTVENVTGASS